MTGRGERSTERTLALLCMVFVFLGLLLSGGWRLIGSTEENGGLPARPVALVRAALVSVRAPEAQTGASAERPQGEQLHAAAPAPEKPILSSRIARDANGNVLGSRSYLHAVYQAFALGDGFV